MELQNVTPAQVRSVYSGRAGKCCCGCAGKHSYNSKHVPEASLRRGYAVSDDEVSDANVTRVLRLVQANEALAESGDGCIFADVGSRRFIVYLCDSAQVSS